MNYSISKHFTIAELVSKQVLDLWGERATWFIDPRIIEYLEFMRSRFGVVYVNNWFWGGKSDSRGFRNYDDPDGGKNSQHRYGRAVDITFKNFTPDIVRDDIKVNWEELYKPLGISTIEEDVNWIHADLRYIRGQQTLNIVYP